MSAPSRDVISPSLHHINIKTTRLQEMIDWYVAVVGAKVNFQFPAGAFLTNDRANHRIAGCRRGQINIVADTIQAAGVRKRGELNYAHLL